MRYLVQDSVDNGTTWRPLSLVGRELTFRTKAEAKAWFIAFEEANNLDWRVGFHLCTRDHKHFRLVTKKTGEPVVMDWAGGVTVRSDMEPPFLEEFELFALEYYRSPKELQDFLWAQRNSITKEEFVQALEIFLKECS